MKGRSSDSTRKEEALMFFLRGWEEVVPLKNSSEEVPALKLRKRLTPRWVELNLGSRLSTLFRAYWRRGVEFEFSKRDYLRTRIMNREDSGRGFSKEESFKVKLKVALKLLKEEAL